MSEHEPNLTDDELKRYDILFLAGAYFDDVKATAIDFAWAIDRLREQLAAATKRAEEAERERDRMREGLEAIEERCEEDGSDDLLEVAQALLAPAPETPPANLGRARPSTITGDVEVDPEQGEVRS